MPNIKFVFVVTVADEQIYWYGKFTQQPNDFYFIFKNNNYNYISDFGGMCSFVIYRWLTSKCLPVKQFFVG